MPFALGAGALGATTSIIGGGKQAKATKEAAQTQANAANHATDIAKSEFDQEQANIQPWLQAGSTDLATLQSNLPALTASFDPAQHGVAPTFSYNPSDFQSDPAFTSAMRMGTAAIQRSAAAKGNVLGGATLKSLDQYGIDTANQFYNQDRTAAQQTYDDNYSHAFNTYQSNQTGAFNKLAALAGVGQTATSQIGQAGQAFANSAGSNALAAGNAASAGIIGSSNALSSAYGSAAGAISGTFSNPNVSSYLTSKFGGSSSEVATGHGIPSTSTQWGDD